MKKIFIVALCLAPYAILACVPVDRKPVAAVTEFDAHNFDVSVKGQLASDCGLPNTNDRLKWESSKGDALDKVAACITTGELKDRKIRVKAFTDARGTVGYNKTLGKVRADAVADYLISKGVPADHIYKTTHGENLAAGDNNNEYQGDRHVDVEIYN